jgi:hypothetical protein
MRFSSYPSVTFSLILIGASFIVQRTRADATLSITNQPAFSRLRPCAQACIWENNYDNGVCNVLQCNDLDAIYCRPDLQSEASSALTSCINEYCTTNAVDISSGIALYNGYCGINGATLENYLPTTGASGTTTLMAAPGSTPTVVIYSTVVSGSSTIATRTSEWLRVMVPLVVAAASRAGLFGP